MGENSLNFVRPCAVEPEHRSPIRRESSHLPPGAERETGAPIARFMESLFSFFRMHWDHEPRCGQRRAGVSPAQRARKRERESKPAVGFTNGGRRDARPTLRFMESPHGFDAVHWEHERRTKVRLCGQRAAGIFVGREEVMRELLSIARSPVASSPASSAASGVSPSGTGAIPGGTPGKLAAGTDALRWGAHSRATSLGGAGDKRNFSG